jgi:hypothetical protein
MEGGAVACSITGGLLIRVVSTYGVGGFAMIEARDSGESSIAGGADADIRPVEGWVGGVRDAGTGAGAAEDGAEAWARFSLFGTARGIGTGRDEVGLVCDFRLSPGVACVVGTAALVVLACPLEGGIKADSDSNFGTSK